MTVTAIKTAYEQLGQHIAEYNDLLNAISILKWDARTQMPSGGSETRGQQLSTLSRVAQEKFASDTTAALLDTAESEVANENMDAFPYRRRSVEQIRRYYNIVRRIPSELLGRKVALSTVAQQVWDAAKKNNDFASFAPYLKQMVEINRALADAIGYSDHPFDALVYEYEPTMTAAKLKALFAELRGQVLPLLRRIVAATESLPVNLWERTYPAEAQRAFGLEIAQKFGYDLTRGRLDISPHPFEVSFTRQDVRITTRYDQHYLPMALFGIFHETGHALYEQGVAPELTRSALTTDFLGQYAVGGTSYGAHESQSRLWENQIGRSREFWELHLPRLKEYFPEQLADVDADLFYRAINRVQPSLIRTEADEVTYNFHIMVRVEIIMGLLDGSLTVEQLPEVWNAQMKEYLGVEVPNDSKGVLQDVHFASGGFSSFPAYTIGNIMSSQLYEAAHEQIPALASKLASGDYAPLRKWLTENVYRHGRAFNVDELLERSTGTAFNIAPYVRYLENKYTELYKLN